VFYVSFNLEWFVNFFLFYRNTCQRHTMWLSIGFSNFFFKPFSCCIKTYIYDRCKVSQCVFCRENVKAKTSTIHQILTTKSTSHWLDIMDSIHYVSVQGSCMRAFLSLGFYFLVVYSCFKWYSVVLFFFFKHLKIITVIFVADWWIQKVDLLALASIHLWEMAKCMKCIKCIQIWWQCCLESKQTV